MKTQTLLFPTLFITIFLVGFPIKSITAQPCLPLGIAFTSQAQIDAFATNYPGCTQVIGEVRIEESSNGNITNLNGLSPLTSIGGSLYVVVNDSLTNLSGLDNLTSIGGSLEVVFNTSLTDFSGLNSLTSITAGLNVGSNESLTDLSGLGNLTSIGGSLFVPDNEALPDLSGLDNLTSIGAGLFVSTNASMTSLDGLENLNSVGGLLLIDNNVSLTDLSGLHDVNATTINNLYLRDNLNLSICEVQSICDYLGIPANLASISGNAVGCSTRPEVQMACDAVPINEIFAIEQGIEIFPNPTTESFKINGVDMGEMKILDSLGRLIKRETISNQGMDISELPDGIYFLLINSPDQLITRRIIKN